MHIDLDLWEAADARSYRFCIVGAGIAGLVLARRLVEAGFTVCLLEAGGLELEERSQRLYEAEMAAAVHTGSRDGRFRTFGGSSTRWGGQLLPYTEDVFAPPPGVPSPGWPIAERAIEEFYPEAQRIMGVGALPFTEELLPKLGHPAVPFSDAVRLRYSKWAPFAKRNLAHTVGAACLAHPLVTVFTHANAAELRAGDGRVKTARVVDYRGRSFEFAADCFVVAAGTVESSRLLLSSETVPNAHDQMGRYFHDHVSFHAAVVPVGTRAETMRRLGPFFVDGVLHTCKIEASAALRQRLGLAAVMAHFVVREPEDSGIAAVRNLLTAVQRGRLKEAVTENMRTLLWGLPDVARLAWASKVGKRRAVSRRGEVRLNIDLEQTGDARNRVRLSEARDALGLRKAVVDWRIGDGEYAAAAAFAPVIRREFAALGFGPLEWTPGLLEGGRPEMADTYHPMGGLRMGTRAEESVVDADLKAHGMDNLYVASCAVYPSGGSSNPTFTLMALALRLAEHLRRRAGVPVYKGRLHAAGEARPA